MKHRIKIRDLKRLLKESLLAEGNEVPEESGDSLDSQVDKYLGEYESEAKNSKNEGLNFRAMTLRFLREVGEDEGSESKVPADDSGGKLTEDDIELETFVNSVVRLIDNYDSLLEVRNTLVRRAKNFLTKSYEEAVVQKFEDILREEHGIEDGKSKMDIADEEFPAPSAARAGDGGAGGASA